MLLYHLLFLTFEAAIEILLSTHPTLQPSAFQSPCVVITVTTTRAGRVLTMTVLPARNDTNFPGVRTDGLHGPATQKVIDRFQEITRPCGGEILDKEHVKMHFQKAGAEDESW